MSKAMPTAPSAPLVEDQHLVGHHPPPPPSYEQAMGHPGFVPPPAQPQMAPYPTQHSYMVPGLMPQMQQPVPPPPQPAPVLPPPTTTVIVAGALPVGPKAMKVVCPICHVDIKTTTVSENQAGAHIACIVLCLLGCCLCSCIPYCMDSCKSVRHTCPNCNSYLGTYKA
ncbi:lipopolysaccharide-induced tumor necrosis factor-alpha factor homolog [Periplaneta americana]|uniref:lipopolysaccharide-induced tumor necrosis factor-alpha factor homolog n=1 Tax=Periplaneta americana TaxID=6978 RepID=UPI0037E92530